MPRLVPSKCADELPAHADRELERTHFVADDDYE